jgi:hypothetical protein
MWSRLAPLLVLAWPFLFFWRRVWPVGGQYNVVGNDFQPWHYAPKAFLLDQLSSGRFPLWAPSESAGFPFYSNPHAQAFYPLNLLALAYQEAAGGYELIDHQRFTVLGCSILGLGCYGWLRSAGLDTRAALVASLLVPVSFKLAELIRFTSAVHTAAWFPWVLLALTLLFKDATLAGKARAGAGLCAALVLMVTAGYTYFPYFSIALFVPFTLLLIWPATAPDLLGGARAVRPAQAVAVGAAAVGVAAAACAPLLVKVAQLVAQADRRSGGGLAYSGQWGYAWLDTLGAFLFPPASRYTNGWLYASGVALLLAAAAIASRSLSAALRACLAAWFVVVTLITWGPASPLFQLLWRHVPGFDVLRAWPRINIVLVPLLALLVAHGYRRVESLAIDRATARDRERRGLAATIVAVAIVVGAVQLWLLRRGSSNHEWSRIAPPHAAWLLVAGLVAGALVLLAWLARGGGRSVRAGLLGCAVVGVGTLDLAVVGPSLYDAAEPVRVAERRALHSTEWPMRSFATRRGRHPGLSLGPRFSVRWVPYWSFARTVRFMEWSATQRPKAVNRLLGLRDGQKLFFSERIAHASVVDFIRDAGRSPAIVRPVAYDGDTLHVDVATPAEGYLSFVDNWDPDWQAFVDSRPARLETLFGTFKSVRVPAGRHRVVFAYRPSVFGWRRSIAHTTHES